MIKFLSDSITTKKFQPMYQELGIVDNPKKQQTLVGRILLAKLVGIPEKNAIENVGIEFGSHGKPFFIADKYYFNIAHSHEGVLVAISDQPIGVDLEKIRPYDYHKIKRAFSADETSYIENLKQPRQGETALRLWTVKESVLKLIGIGLAGKPKTVQVNVPRMDVAARDNVKYKINFLDVGFGFIGTLVTKDGKQDE